MAEGVDALAVGLEAVAERPPDGRGKVRQPAPVDRGLEGVDRVAEIPQRVAQVGGPEPAPEPLPAERAADARPAVSPHDRARPRGPPARRASRRPTPRRGGGTAPARSSGARGSAGAGGRLARRRRGRGASRSRAGSTGGPSRAADAGPGDVAGGLEGARPIRQEPRRDGLDARPRDDPDGRPRSGSRAGPPSRARAGGGPGRRPMRGAVAGRAGRPAPRRWPPANRRLDPPEPDRLLAGRAGRDPAAERRSAPRTAGSGRASARAGRAPPRGRGRVVPAPKVASPLRSSRAAEPGERRPWRP